MKATGERFIPNAGMDTEIELEHMHRYQAIAPLLEGMTVLDAASGAGYGSCLLAARAASVVGIDIDREAVDYARAHYGRDNLSFMQMSIADLSFPDASFDAIVSFETIEHVSEELQKAFLAQVRRVLKPDGFFVVSTPDLDVAMRRSHGTYHNPFHVKEYNASDFHALLSQYFPHITMHRQGKVRCSVIDGEGMALLNDAPDRMEGEYIIAVCSMQERRLPLGSAYQPKEPAETICSTLFFDYGSWYSENEKQLLSLCPDINGQFLVTFPIPRSASCRAVRFDPVEGRGCVVTDFHVRADGRDCAFAALNAIERGSELLFANADPQIEIILPADTQELELSGNLFLLPIGETVNEVLREKDWQLAEEKERSAQLFQEKAALALQAEETLAKQMCVIAQQQSQLTEQNDTIAQQQSQINCLAEASMRANTMMQLAKWDYEELQREKDTVASEARCFWPYRRLQGFRMLLVNLLKCSLRSAYLNWRGQGLIQQSGLFDYFSYLRDNGDVRDSGMDPLIHYIWYGGKEGRNPNKDFDSAEYLRTYPDVANSGLNPYVHYLLFGQKEGRVCFLPARKPTPQWLSSIERTLHCSESMLAESGKSPCVSIIMPTWNRRNLIVRAIDSVLLQTYTNYELLISDDGSTDGTEELLRTRYAPQLRSGRIRYFVLEKGGVCKARNYGLSQAKGELIAYLDSDNEWHENYLKTMVSAFSQSDVSCAYADLNGIDNVTGNRWQLGREYDRKALLVENFIDMNIFMHRRSVYENCGGFDASLRMLEDWDLILRYTAKGAPVHVREALVNYYVEKNANRVSETERYVENRAIIWEKNRKERDAYGLCEELPKKPTVVGDKVRFLVIGIQHEISILYEPFAEIIRGEIGNAAFQQPYAFSPKNMERYLSRYSDKNWKKLGFIPISVWRRFSTLQNLEIADGEKVYLLFLIGRHVGRLYDPGLLKKLKRTHGDKICTVLLLLDSMEAAQDCYDWRTVQRCFPSYDMVATFDAEDAKAHHLVRINTPYCAREIPQNDKPESGMFFIGVDRGRSETLIKIAQHAAQNGITCDFQIFHPECSEALPEGVSALTNAIPYEEVLQYVGKTDCIVEVVEGGQNGPSLRYYEAVVYNKKLLTNNPHVLNAEFYDPKYIQYFNDPDAIDYQWLKEKVAVDYHYNGEYSAAHLLRQISAADADNGESR